MSGHTPGPWFVGVTLAPQHGEDVPAIVGDRDSVVALLPGNWNFCTKNEANARLIAAAPELLEALERVIRRVDGNSYCLGAEVLAIALPAVTKATTP